MKPPFFSIVTAVLNAKDGLEKTAISLHSQTCSDFEWIVIDGGSTDGTLDVAKAWADPSRDIVLSEADGGVYFAMNKGLRLAKGDVVQFLNANDWLASDQVLTEVRAVFDGRVDAVYGDTELFLADGRTVTRTADDPGRVLHRRMPFSHQALFTRRELHLRYPFNTDLRIAADKAAISRMYMADAKFSHLRSVVNVNTIEAGAISVSGKVLSASEDYRISVEILKRPRYEALFYLCKKRLVIAAVNVLERLPKPLLEALPQNIRRRIY